MNLKDKCCQYCSAPLTVNQRKNCAACTLKIRHARNQEWHKTHKVQRRKNDLKNHQSPSYRWHCLLRNAKRRSFEVSITREHFEEESIKPCFYCKGNLDTDLGQGAHLDRLNNQLGYIADNIVSCCNFCNKIKQDLLSVKETIKVISVLVEMRKIVS